MSDSIPEIVVRNPGDADEAQMIELLSEAFDGWPPFEIPVRPVEHLRWKLRSDPIARRHNWIAESDGRIIAMALRVIRRIRVRGQDCLTRDGVDAAVDPRYRERGLYTAMAEETKQRPQHSEVDLFVFFSSNPPLLAQSARKGSLLLGNPIRALHKPYRVRAIVERSREKQRGRLPAPLAVLRMKLGTALKRLGHPPLWRPLRPDWSISTLKRFDARIDAFFDEAARSFDFLLVRSEDYLNWRYCEPAAGRFTVRVAEREGRILGYLVFKINEGTAYIADLLALPGRLDVVRSLIEDALRLSREARAELVSCWIIARHPYNGLLRRYGFVDSGREIGFKYKAITLDPEALEFLEENTARVHLMQGDSDWI